MMQDTGCSQVTPNVRSRRTVILRKKLAYVRGNNHSSRALRFKDIMVAGSIERESHSFKDVASLPDWILLDTETQDLIGLCAAILNERVAIDRELSGERLSAISAVVGDALFEELCEVTLPLPVQAANLQKVDSGQRLSRPEDFEVIGQELRIKAMQYSFGQSEIENLPSMLCDIAAYVVSGRHIDATQTEKSKSSGV